MSLSSPAAPSAAQIKLRLAPVASPGRVVAPGDNQLMARMQDGSVPAFGELYDRYRDRAFRVARSVSADEAQAEEAVQEGFVAIWKSRATYRPERATAAAWLLTVVRHRAIDIGRRNASHAARRVSDHALMDSRSQEDVAGQAVDRADAHHLKALLAGLPDGQREVIVLAFYGELTHTEIAAELGLPIGTVKGRMRGGLHKLRVELGTAAA